ncbi:hypothetical protein BJY01DRAFT_233050 [Aspergillus pseudoustus]|uniref:Arrestin C-terminal-like domain-containing protein n=1 Tax=Aspergillus pseudoustus TaxID=1810923 RepID=A0ABR4KFP8_9EURO
MLSVNMMFGPDIASHSLHLDQSTFYLPYHHEQGSFISVTGRLQLSLARPTAFKCIKARVIGKLRTPRYGILMPAIHEETTIERTQNLAFSKSLPSFTMPSGDYEFPFQISLDGSLVETLTGPRHEYHTYAVELVIQRRMKQDLIISQALKIYKIPPGDISVMSHKAVEETSNEDIQYYISIPNALVRHGSVFPVECWIETVSKDLTIESITVSVHEKHDLRLRATAAESMQYDTNFITWHHDYVVFAALCELSQHRATPTLSENQHGVHQVTIPVRLPRSLEACTQTFTSRSIKIEHLLSVDIEYRGGNTSGVTKITRTVPVYIYMGQNPKQRTELEGHREDQWSVTERKCPPIYGQHELDEMLSAHTELGDDIYSDVVWVNTM